MTQHSFALVPFQSPLVPAITIQGNVSRRDNVIFLHFSLLGDLTEIYLPERSHVPGRVDKLWNTTCFEFFLARTMQPQYWEFNLSPARDWNTYRMDAYRRIGFRPELSIEAIEITTRTEAEIFMLSTALDLTPLFQPDELVQLGVAAVIKTTDGVESYWALCHPGAQADFHLRESFILELAAQTHPATQSAPGD